MNNAVKMVSTIKRACACVLGVLAFTAGAVTVTVDKPTTHYPWNGKVDISYRVGDIVNESSYALKVVVRADRDYVVRTETVSENRLYKYTWDAAEAGFTGRVEKAQVIVDIASPAYAIVDLTRQVQGQYPISYRTAVDATSDEYKKDKLLLKLVASGGVTNFVGVYEVTQAQYERVMGMNPSFFTEYADKSVEAQRPVERVSYETLTQNGFFAKLCARTDNFPFTLPSGADWQAAACGPSVKDRSAATLAKTFDIGASEQTVLTGRSKEDNVWLPTIGRYVDLWNGTTKKANDNANANRYSDGSKGTAVVGKYAVNGNGLYDMHGNVAEWTTDGGDGYHVLRGGSWLDSDANCAIGATWAYPDKDTSQLNRIGFRVFAKVQDAAVLQPVSRASDKFPLDVAVDKTRYLTVDDKAGTPVFTYYPIYYYQTAATSRDWVKFDEGDTNWRPSQCGMNVATFAKTGEKAYFYVKPLEISFTVTNKTVVYNGQPQTIKPDIAASAVGCEVLYWCEDVPDQDTEAKAKTNLIEFTGVKYDGLAVTNRVINFKITSDFYTTAATNALLTIEPRAITNATVKLGPSPVYTGTAVTQTIESVTVDGLELQEGRDYTVVGNVATNFGTYVMTLTGVSNFVDNVSTNWSLATRDIADAKIVFDETDLIYNGEGQEKKIKYVTMKIGGKSVRVKYEVVDNSNWGTNAAEYVCTVKGKAPFSGAATGKWEILKCSITNAVAAGTTNFVYNGMPQKIGRSNVTSVQCPGVTGTVADYTVACDAKTDVGAYNYTVTANDPNYTDQSTNNVWTISPRALSNVTFTVYGTYFYNGSAHEPTAKDIDATDGGLSKGAQAISTNDWTVTGYEDNLNAGTGTVTLAGINNYGGTATAKFFIAPAAITSLTLTPTNLVWNGQLQKPDATVKAGKVELDPADYTREVDSAKDVGCYWTKATAKEGGNFSGSSASVAWTIVPTAPEITWMGYDKATKTMTKQATTNQTDFPVFEYATKDLTVAFNAFGPGEKLTITAWTNYFDSVSQTNVWVKYDGLKISDNRTRITFRTRLSVVAKKGGLESAPSTVELVPGQCCDPAISVTGTLDRAGQPLAAGATNFYRNATKVLIARTNTVSGGNEPLDPEGGAWDNKDGTIYYTLLDATNGTRVADAEYDEVEGFTISSDAVTVIAQIKGQDRLDSIVVTQKLTRVIEKFAAPKIRIESIPGRPSAERRITIARDFVGDEAVPFGPGTNVYYTIDRKVGGVAKAIDPMALQGSDADEDWVAAYGVRKKATTKYEGPFEITLDLYETNEVKAVAYAEYDGGSDFYGRSAVAVTNSVRDWTIGDALDAPDQEFYNGTNTVAGKYSPTNTLWTRVMTNADFKAYGPDCMRSGVLTKEGETSSLTTFVKGPGLLVFNWKANCVADIDPSQQNWDRGEFWLDSGIDKKPNLKIDGTNECWTTVTNILDNSVEQHALTWTYVKVYPTQEGGVIPPGQDCVYLDKFVWVPAPAMKDIKIEIPDLTFNNAAQKPTYTLTATDLRTAQPTQLVENVDFTVSYPNDYPEAGQTNAGTYKITFAATANTTFVTGSNTVDWTIKPLSLTNAKVTLAENPTFDGTEKTMTVTSILATHPKQGPVEVVGCTGSYTLEGTFKAINEGSYKFTVTGKDNLADTAPESSWKILAKPISGGDISVTLEPETFTYNRQGQEPDVTVTDTTRGTAPGAVLTNGTDYVVAFLSDGDYTSDITNVGTKVAIVTAKGNYSGAVTNYYVINKAGIETLVLNEPTTLTYNGEEQFVTVKSVTTTNGVAVTDADYTVTGTNGMNATSYTATVMADSRNFHGTASATWTINPLSVTGAQLTLEPSAYSFVYDGAMHWVTNGTDPNQVKSAKVVESAKVKVGNVQLDIHGYNVECNPTNVVGEYKFKLIPTDTNFSGTNEYPWSIGPRSITNATITLTTNLVWNGEAEWAITNTTVTRKIIEEPTPQTQTFTVMDGDKKLEPNTDYTIESDSNVGTDAGAYTLTIKGKEKGNYSGTATKAWMIAPTMPMVHPKNNPQGTNEIYALTEDDVDILTGRDLDAWGVHYKLTDGEGKKLIEKNFESRAAGGRIWSLKDENRKRTIYEAFTYLKANPAVTSVAIRVDYRLGTTADPTVCFADTNNVPCLYVDGKAWTNTVGAVNTNFFHNGQLVALTRGNIGVSNLWDGVEERVAFTNKTGAVYTDGTLRYKYWENGAMEPADWNDWTAETRIAISNTTTVIAKVFGKDYADSACVTNVFVREYETYAAPLVTYRKVGETGWTTATTDRVEFKVAGLNAQVADTNAVAVADTTRTIWCVTNGCEQFAYPAGGFTFDGTVKLVTWIADTNGEYASSPTNTVEFSMDDTLSAPGIAFSNAVETAQYQLLDATTFTNAYQWICITNAGEVFTKDTDGEIWFRTNSAPGFVKYVAPFQIWTNTTVEAFKTNSVYGLKSSATNKVEFKQQMATLDKPVVTINPTVTVKYFEIAITNAVEDVSDYVTYYTLDGTEPVGINGAGKTPSAKFTGAAFTTKVYVEAGSNLTVRAKAFREVNDNSDFVAVSPEGTASTNRAVTIGDYLREGLEEKKTEAPSTADLDAVSEVGDGYNTEWWDDSEPPMSFDTSWVYDDVVAYTNDVGGVTGGKSMRSGKVQNSGFGIEEGTNSVMTATVYGPGTFTFWWKASVEFEPYGSYDTVWDFCELLVDGAPALDELGDPIIIWGTNYWTEVTYTITETDEATTNHVIQWNYVKDDAQYTEEELGTSIQDCVWVDEFVWTASAMMDQCDIVPEPLTYNQAEQFPTFYVTNRVTGAALTNGVDYTVETNKQTKAGTYTATLKGRGTTYTGTNTVEWTIAQLSITNAVVTLDYDTLVYDVTNQTVNVKKVVVPGAAAGRADLNVTEEGWTVEGNTGATNATYTLTVSATADGNLTNAVTTTWKIDPRPLAADMITLVGDLTYAGGAVRTQEFVVAYNGETLTNDVHYTVQAGSDAGTTVGGNTIKINAIEPGNYKGSAEKAWTMNKLDITEGVPTLDMTNLVYNGKCQTVTVTNLAVDLKGWGANPINLTTNEEWILIGNVATNAGTYKVTLNPNSDGNLTGGPVTIEWTISPAGIGDTTITFSEPTYDGTEGKKPQDIKVTHPTIGELEEGVDYEVKVEGMKNAGKYEMEIKGKENSNFAGTTNVAWQLLPAVIDSVAYTTSSYVYDGTVRTPELVVKAGTLTPVYDTDYKTNGTSSAMAAGVYTNWVFDCFNRTATSGETGNYKLPTEDGKTNVTWTITPCPLKTLTFEQSYTETTYNRGEQKPVVTVKCGDTELKLGTDYTLDYTGCNCTNAGTVTYKVFGTGSVVGETNLTYTIKKAVIKSFDFNGKSKIEYSGKEESVDARNVKTDNGLVLKKGTEWKFEDSGLTTYHATDVGDYTASILAADTDNIEVKDAVAKTWKITPADIDGKEIVVALAKDIEYTAKTDRTIEDGDPTGVAVKLGGTEYKLENYSFACTPQKTVGKHKATVTVVNDPNFKGTADVEWEVVPRDITGGTVTFVKDPLLWTGSELTVQMKDLTVGGCEFQATDTTFSYDGDKATDAGTHDITVTGSDNFKNTTTGKWQIKPTAPTIKPGDGGKYSAILPYITVEITRDCDDWSVTYTTNGTDWVLSECEDVKIDISKRTAVQARTISNDSTTTSDVQKVEYYFGENVDPMVALYAADTNAVPTDAEVKGAGDLIVVPGSDVPYTNFYHSAALVNLTRFGTMTAEEIVARTNDTTYIVGDKPVCPYTDGEVWYTVAVGDAAIVAPTNVEDGVSKRFDPDDKSTWPKISTNATIVAQVFGDQLENSAPITNVFNRIWTKMPAPNMTASMGERFQFTNVITLATNDYVGVDATVTNGMQKLYYTLDGSVPTKDSKLYTGPISLTWKDCDANGKVSVQAISYYGEDYLASDVVSNEYTHFTTKYTTPTMTPSATFHHRNDEFGKVKGYEVALTNMAPTEAGGELQWSYDGENWTKYTDPLWVTDTTNVCARVAPTAGVHDYTASDVVTNTFTYAPYQYNAPVLDKSTDYTTPTITFKLSRPAAPECGDAGVVYYTLDDSDPATSSTRQQLNGDSKTFTTNATVTIRAIMVDPAPNKDHLDSAEATAIYKRVLDVNTVKVYLVDADGKPIMDEKDSSKYATNFWHKANLKMETAATDVQIVYESDEIGSGTYTTGQTIPVSNSFEVAVKLVLGTSESATATNAFTRKWEKLMDPTLLLKNPDGVLTNRFWNTGDSFVITTNIFGGIHTAAIWPTNVTFRYAVFTNSTVVVPDTELLPFVRGETVARFGADTNAVILVVEAEDYLPATNSYAGTSARSPSLRRLNPIGKPTIALSNEGHRERVDVTLDMPEGANAMYYTYAITNDADGVATPWGSEYCVSNATDRYTNACFSVALKPHETLIVKARAYVEDNSSELVGLAETNFTARSEVAVSEPFSYDWSLADGLDAPDWKTFTSTSSQRENLDAAAVEDDEVKNFGDSSVRFEGVADSQWLSVETTVEGPGTVVFDWKTDCEKGQHDYNYDHMTFYVNGTPILKLDGDSGWQTVTNRINGGMSTKNVLKWVYEKDDSEHGKTPSLAWLDHFQWFKGESQLEITQELDDWAFEYLDEDDYWALYNEDDSPNYDEWQKMLAWKAACNDRTYWECYVLGLDPTDPDATFVITAPVLNEFVGTASVTFVPRMAGRTYTLVGKKELNDVYWADLAVINADKTDLENPTTIKSPTGTIASANHPEWAGYKYFTLRVKMTPKAK